MKVGYNLCSYTINKFYFNILLNLFFNCILYISFSYKFFIINNFINCKFKNCMKNDLFLNKLHTIVNNYMSYNLNK